MRERGLKYEAKLHLHNSFSRSREGAWIEIINLNYQNRAQIVAPVRERGLKYQLAFTIINTIKVAPVRERGLKFRSPILEKLWPCRSREGAWIEIYHP